MNKPYEGLFITLEGGEGAGKSTLAEKLYAKFSSMGRTVIRTREPGGTRLSEKLRELLLNQKNEITISEKAELLLFLTARVQNIEEVILPALHQNKVVICDRFNDSSVAYQGCARHLGMSFVEDLCQLVCGKIEPDCTLFLDLDPEVGLKRLAQFRKKESDRLEEERLQFHKEVRQGFLHLADKYPHRIKVINGAASEEEVFLESMKHLQKLL